MVHYFNIRELKDVWRAKLERGDIEVYDVTHKFLKADSRQRYHSHKWLGNSMVFSYGRRNKILLYGLGVFKRVRDLETGKLVEYGNRE